MHESMKRLLDFVRSVSSEPREFADIGADMDASPQTVTNWKKRGISQEGALRAEELFGCPATWLLSGTMPPIAASAPDVMSETAQLLQDIADMPEQQRLRAIIAAGRAVAAVRNGTRDAEPTTTTDKHRGGSQPKTEQLPAPETAPR